MLRLAVALGLVVVLAPPVSAAPACSSEQPDAPVYVIATTSDVEVWTESNRLPGLQREPCEGAEGRIVPSDTTNFRSAIPGEDDLPCRIEGRFVVCS